MFRRCVLLMVLLLGLLQVPAWAAAKPDVQTDVLTFGVVSYVNAAQMEQALKPFLTFLEKELGTRILVKLYPDYQAILSDIDQETLDLAMLSPVVYSLCMDDPALTLLGTVLRKEKPVYHSVILARKDGPVTRPDQLLGKRIGFVDTHSASGYVYPAAFFQRSGLIKDGEPAYLPTFWGTHEKVLRALMEGYIDAAATYDGVFDLLNYQVGENRNVRLDQFRLLKLLPERIPEDALACRAALGDKVIQRLLAALQGFAGAARQTPAGDRSQLISGFKVGNRTAYEDVRAFLQNVMEER